MASTLLLSSLLIVCLSLQCFHASSDILSPIFSPIPVDVCKEVECGKGSCKPSNSSRFFHECECEAGWKQVPSDFKFLPCVVPNCTFDVTCTKASPPVQDKASGSNESIFSPCHWVDCGGGACNKTSAFSYSCTCEEGYNNLLNLTVLPCFKECAIGMDCLNLGISTSNTSTSPSPSLAANGDKKASALLRGNSWWFIALITVLSFIIRW